MNSLWNYIKLRWPVYVLTSMVVGLFYSVYFLYGGIVEALHYATLLSFSILIVYFIVDYALFYRKDKRLQYLLALDEVIISELPRVSSSIESQYKDLLLKVERLHKDLESHIEKEYHDSIDYFTLWVHQIKTPISALRLLIQSQEGSQNDVLMQILRIEQYVDMALYYMKMNHMSSDLKLKTYSLSTIVNGVIKKQATFFIQKKIRLDLDKIDLNILTDEKWISFVIEQLLSNALKYTREGTISIYVKKETLYIEDTGIGIKKEDIPRVFEKGFTGYNGRVDKKASGLGLYLCKSIIGNLGHSLKIESDIGKGTKVSLDFYKEKLDIE